MRLLVTGGCGFVGSNFIQYILQHYGPEMITNVDALTSGRLANLEGVVQTYGDRYEFLQAEAADPDKINAVLAKHQFFAVVHFAAEAAGVAGVTALLKQARRHGVRRFLVVSRERDQGALEPVEAAALAAWRDHGQEVVITRGADGYGPYQPLTGFIPGTIARALRDEPVILPGDGTQARDWLHVEDYCGALFTALLDGEPGTIHRFGTGSETRDIDLAQRILEQLGKSRDLIQLQHHQPPVVESRRSAAVDGDGALEWKARHPLERALRGTVDWYVRNREWWENQPTPDSTEK